MDSKVKISNNYSIDDYYHARNSSDKELIALIFKDRLEARYLKPIIDLNRNSVNNIGYGFSIMAIICSLIEFLASCRNGQYYLYKDDEFFNSSINYYSSKDIFIDFLKKNRPFKSEFNTASYNSKYTNIAEEFYSEVRCPLFHSASTGKDWVIIANIDDYKIKHENDWNNKIISYDYKRLVSNINRTVFVEKLINYGMSYINSVSSKIETYNKLTIFLDHLFDYSPSK